MNLKTTLLLATLLGSILASASDTDVVAFECSDNSLHILAAENLSIRFENENLKADNGIESLLIPLNKLVSFHFGAQASIKPSTEDSVQSPISVFDTKGAFVGSFPSVNSATCTLKPGVYLIKGANVSVSKFHVK